MVDPQDSGIPDVQIHLLANIYLSLQHQCSQSLHGGLQTHPERWKMCHRKYGYPAEDEQGDTAFVFQLSHCKKCPFHTLSGTIFSNFCVSCWWFHCFKWPPKCPAKVLSRVTKCRTAVTALTIYNEVSLNCCLLSMKHPGGLAGLCPEVTSFSQ